jgi:hypothetical protein
LSLKVTEEKERREEKFSENKHHGLLDRHVIPM